MHRSQRAFALSSLLSIILSGCSASSTTTSTSAISPNLTRAFTCQKPAPIPPTNASLHSLKFIGSHVSEAPFDESAAEIVSYDSCTDQLFVVNAHAKRVDVMVFNRANQPVERTYLDLTQAATSAGIEIGAANSVSAHHGLVAVAIENKDKQLRGIIALYRADTLELLTTYKAGALPDMVGFSPDGRYIASANEGEPNNDYTSDPEGSVTLIDLKAGLDNALVKQINFKAFNRSGALASKLPAQVRISKPGATVAQDLEPEYLTFAGKGKIFVSLQENNAIAKIDITSAKVQAIYALGDKPWQHAMLDASDKDHIAGHLKSYPQLAGLYMPDTIASYQVDGVTYLVSANEGDSREYAIQTTEQDCDERGLNWDGDDYSQTPAYTMKKGTCIVYSDEIRGKHLIVPKTHPLYHALKDNNQLARLKFIKPTKALNTTDVLHSYGARSFSIWREDGTLVFDSGDEFAYLIHHYDGANFNANNDSNLSSDKRSDDKGSEPEALEVAHINGHDYAFIGLERQSGIFVYDISKPAGAQFVTYMNHRNFNAPVCTKSNADGECANHQYNPAAGDLGPESIKYFTRQGRHYIAVGNEVSGTTSIYQLLFN